MKHESKTGADIVEEAFAEFDRWCAIIDPDGDLDILQLVELYNKRHLVKQDIEDYCRLGDEGPVND